MFETMGDARTLVGRGNMKLATLLLTMILAACSSGSGASGPAQCVAAGGDCRIPNPDNPCANRGPQNCNPDLTPAGAFCCLPCPSGTHANDAGTACE
jgi:hypothetical protein